MSKTPKVSLLIVLMFKLKNLSKYVQSCLLHQSYLNEETYPQTGWGTSLSVVYISIGHAVFRCTGELSVTGMTCIWTSEAFTNLFLWLGFGSNSLQIYADLSLIVRGSNNKTGERYTYASHSLSNILFRKRRVGYLMLLRCFFDHKISNFCSKTTS